MHKPPPSVLVWDLPTRLFHWSLVALVAFMWYSGEEGGNLMDYHLLGGYAIGSLVLFRLLWGVLGSESARFAGFVRGPHAVLRHLRAMRAGHAEFTPGHNALGGWAVLALLLLLALQVGTGLFANDDILTEGPLARLAGKDWSDTLTGLHKDVFDVLLLLIALHVAAIGFYRLRTGENLLTPMITGRKPLAGPAPRLASPWLALALLALAAAGMWGLVNLT